MSARRSLVRYGFDDLVSHIYDAVDEPDGITKVLGDVADWVSERRGTRAQTLVIARGGEVVENWHWGLDPDRFESYAVNWVGKDPRMAAARARPGVVLTDTVDVDRAAFERSAIFNEALVLDDSIFSLFGTFPLEGDLILGQAFIRGRRDGAFEPHHADRMRALIPHIGRAIRMREVVETLEDAREDLGRALHALPAPALLLDQAARIVAANTSAERLIREGVLTARGGKLGAASPSEDRELMGAMTRTLLVADLSRTEGSAKLRAMPVKLSRPEGRDVWVLVYPLRPRSTLRRVSRSARVLAIIHDPRARVRLAPELLVKLHGLTPTEAALASALVDGLSVAEFARARGCTEETARTHLKRVLEKVGTRRQPDLVRSLLASAALHSLG